LEKAGILTVQITAALPVAKMVGANRTVLGNGIVHVVGDAEATPEKEKEVPRRLVEQALNALKSDEQQRWITLLSACHDDLRNSFD
jgi:glycine/betaine/sarcosine/D-proline reductase family selenoprotein B